MKMIYRRGRRNMVQEIGADPLACFWGEIKCALVRLSRQCVITRRDPTVFSSSAIIDQYTQARLEEPSWVARCGLDFWGALQNWVVLSQSIVVIRRPSPKSAIQ